MSDFVVSQPPLKPFFVTPAQADVLLMVKLRAIWSLVWFVGAICGVSAGASQQRARSVRHTDT